MQIGNTLKVPVTGKVTGSEEKEAIIRVAEENHFSPGKYVEQFEHEFAKFIGKRYALFVNSGSSANLLAVAGFKKYSEMFVLPKTVIPDTAWFSFPLTIKSDAKFNRLDIINYLDKNGIGSRPIMAGNIARQPAYKDTKFIINQELKNSNIVTENSFYIGCWHGLSEEQIEYTINVFDDFIEDIYG